MVVVRLLVIAIVFFFAQNAISDPAHLADNTEYWKIDDTTGHLIAIYDLDDIHNIAFRFNVEGISKGDGCAMQFHPDFIRWTAGYGVNRICYFTVKTPGWIMFDNQRNWIWTSTRTMGIK
tara:strand:- start:572 stop:931 length:360 start_codon:yes stop_codon:yes gene_type:complete